MESRPDGRTDEISRRSFMKRSAAASLAAVALDTGRIYAAGSDRIRVALVGCGDRGTAVARECITASQGIELVAMADVFEDKIHESLASLNMRADDKVSVTRENVFVGFDAYEKVLETDVDLVILATPPHFRPMQLNAVVKAGKHAFIEKPAAVDPVGVRSIIATSELAQKKGLSIAAGTQQRRMPQYVEVMKRIFNGQIGKIVAAQCYWDWGHQDWHFHNRQSQWSDMEWQIRCWPYFTWLGGDHIVEQHCHNLDIINWALGSHPVQCMAIGGRQVRTGEQYGNVFDHFAVEYEYPGGVRVLSMCSQINGTTSRVAERVVGSKGATYTTRGVGYIEGDNPYRFEGESGGGVITTMTALIDGIRQNKPINEGSQLAESTLTAVMGRMSAYTGRALKWDWVMNASKLDLSPEKYELGKLPVRPVAVPGKTKLI